MSYLGYLRDMIAAKAKDEAAWPDGKDGVILVLYSLGLYLFLSFGLDLPIIYFAGTQTAWVRIRDDANNRPSSSSLKSSRAVPPSTKGVRRENDSNI